MALAANSSADEVPRDRLLIAVLGTLRKTALMADLIGQKDDSTTSFLHAMVKAAFFIANKEDRVKLDQDDVVAELGRKLQKYECKLESLNNILLSALGAALHYGIEQWPRDDLKRSVEEVPLERQRIALLGRVREAVSTADLYGLKDDNTTSILHAMLKAAFVFVANKEDRAKLDQEDVVGELGKKIQENEPKLGTLNDILLSAVNEALHYAAAKWPREDLNSTSEGIDASAECDIPSIGVNLGEVIDHPIDTADVEKAISFLPPTDFPPEAEEQERDVVPMDDDDAMEEEGAWRRNLIQDILQRCAMERGTVKEVKYEKTEFDGKLKDHSAGEDDEEEHELSSEGEDEESERTAQSEADSPRLKKRALKKIDSSKRQGNPAKTINLTNLQKIAKITLAILKPSDYEYDGEASSTVGIFKCTRCGRRFNKSANLISHVNTHTGNKPFQCTFCKKSYTRRDNLSYHQRHRCKDAVAAKQKETPRAAQGRKKHTEKR